MDFPVFAAIVFLFFLTAMVYSSVGFGGGSTYLAFLVLFGFSYLSIPKIALICNLIVVSGGTYHYIRAKQFSFRHVLPFIVFSIPSAFFGGSIVINKSTFLFLLASSLLVAGLCLFFLKREERGEKEISWKMALGIGLPAGACLGFLSGLVGIGGGIFLSPLLYFLRWGRAQVITASASFFILVNSLFSLAGQWTKGISFPEGKIIFFFALAVLIGGQIGSFLSVKKFRPIYLQRITAVLVLLVSIRIFWMLFYA